MTLVVRGGEVVTPRSAGPADVVVDADGRIAAVLPAGTAEISGNVTVDAGGLIVLPGMVDGHVHLQEPGREHWEGFDSGSEAAVAGGVTTVIDMPIDCDPPTITADAVAAKAACVVSHSRVDVAIWGGLVPASVGSLDAMADAGVCGFKAFACPSGWDDFPASDEATLDAGMAAAARRNLPVAVHCELEELGHSVDSEVEAVRRAGRIALRHGARLHLVHASASQAVEEAQRFGATVETCAHYLVLTDADADAIGPDAHCTPPIRDAANQERLWALIGTGAIDAVVSDHSPCPGERKDANPPWAGIDGLGMTLPLLMSAGRLRLPDLARVMTASARIAALPGKGDIRPGFDADLVLVDPHATSVLAARSRNRRSPYEGRQVQVQVVMTLVRGRVTFSRDGGVSDQGGGRVIRPVR